MKTRTFTSTAEQNEHNRREFEQLEIDLANAEPTKLPRTWGFEIETPEADKIAGQTTSSHRDILEFHQDGSVSSSDGCECDCSSCAYHDCDCPNCEDQNTDPDHDCGSSWCSGEYQEITSVGGLDTTHPEALALLDELGLSDCEITSDCGLHIHIASADLTPAQVARVMTAYRLASPILLPIAGEHRKHNSYCRPHDPTEEDWARRGQATEKYRAVNTCWHFSPKFGRTNTIEFRQHEGTNDTSRVRAWAWLLVQLVEFGKSERPLYWLGKAQTLTQLIGELKS
jgi:hypothetical protein